MGLHDCLYFNTIWELRSFSKAAEVLNVSQPALSQSIKKLENEFEAPLFKRGKNLELTEMGMLFYTYSKELLQVKERLNDAVAEKHRKRNVTIRIGMSPFYSKYYLPLIIPHVARDFHEVSLKFTEDISMKLEQKLRDGTLDFCFLPEEPKGKEIEYKTVCIEEILLAVPPGNPINSLAVPAYPLPYIDLKHIRNQQFVSLRKVQKISGMIKQICDEVGVERDIVYETLDWDTVNIMIANKVGIGFVSDLLSRSSKGPTSPLYYRILNKTIIRNYSLAYKTGKVFSPLEERIIELFQTQIVDFRQQLFT
jgi:LysR family hydrogen peroxide-inducible transcriptional activator